MSETSFYGYCRETDYREIDTAALKDGVVVKIAAYRFFKVSKLGGWVSHTGDIHTDEELAQIAKSMIDIIRVYA